ncbi:MAG: DUF4326 domain-containing protein [Candidatus Nanopelagicales bacterium]|nr:DUF4326 domain-containing protein [Candidatus Nanopelagicales bacterium]
MTAGEELPPVIVENGTNRLLDGWHRHRAHRILELAEIEILFADIPPGMDARLFAASLSAKHGLPLADADARQIARDLFAQDGDTTITAVAKALGRPRKTVEGWLSDQIEQRREAEQRERDARKVAALMLRDLGWKQKDIAEQLGVDQSAVSRLMHDGDPAVMHTDEGLIRRAIEIVPDADLAAVAEQWREDRIFATWTDDERDLLKRLRAGETVVLNMRGDAHQRLWQWAEQSGLAVRIDRKSEWGNPFVLPGDGTRTEVISKYADYYFPHKPSLHGRTAELEGKALGCWCAPEACHGDYLAGMAS